jgi:hypothetical protein
MWRFCSSPGRACLCPTKRPCGPLHGPANYERAKNAPPSWAARLQSLTLLLQVGEVAYLTTRAVEPFALPAEQIAACPLFDVLGGRKAKQGAPSGDRGVGLAEGVVGRNVFEVVSKRDGRNKNMGLGNLGDLSNLDLGQLQQYLPNLNFPASKDEVISEVQNNDAPQDVVDQIKNSSTDTFNSADEVLQTVRGNR